MKHHKSIRVFGREMNQRNALIRSLALSLVVREKIKTTEAKAKSLRPFVEKLITRAKVDSLANRRLLIARLGSVSGTAKLIEKIAPVHKNRPGGYTRITKLPIRKSDGAKMAVIEIIK